MSTAVSTKGFRERKDHRTYRYRIAKRKNNPVAWPGPGDMRRLIEYNGIKRLVGCSERCHPEVDPNTGHLSLTCRDCKKRKYAVWKRDVPYGTPFTGSVSNHYTWWLLHESQEEHAACPGIKRREARWIIKNMLEKA